MRLYAFKDGSYWCGQAGHWKWTMTPMGWKCRGLLYWVLFYASMYTPLGRLILKACGKTTWPEPLSWVWRQRFFWKMIADRWLTE